MIENTHSRHIDFHILIGEKGTYEIWRYINGFKNELMGYINDLDRAVGITRKLVEKYGTK